MFNVGSTLLDACVLGILRKGDTYGYKLTQQIKEILSISESTLYPVLRRLQREGMLETYDEAVMGRNRRYYRLTEKGKIQSVLYEQEWQQFSEMIEGLLSGKGGMKDE